jgi:membrane dipeptidase
MLTRAGFLLMCLALGALLPLLSVTAQNGVSDKAHDLHFRSIVVDTHDDTTQRLLDPKFNLGVRHSDGSIDIPRMREGGMDAIFFSIWISGTITGPEAVKQAMDQIDAVRQLPVRFPNDIALARTAEDVRRIHSEGKIAALRGVEGGHMIDDDLGVLRDYARLGVRYMTLTHMVDTNWADSSTGKMVHNGLTDFGKQVVREMNRMGIMVDISHVSDKTFYDALAVSEAPMINYLVGFLSQEFRDADRAHPEISKEIAAEVKKRCGEDEGCQLVEGDKVTREYVAQGKLPRVDWTKIIEHIDHAVKLVGADHVGLGSDFDGANMPYGLEDASRLPQITNALLAKGYSESDIQKILGGNTLRVMEHVEIISKRMGGQS